MALWQRGESLLPERNLLAWAQAQRLLPLLGWRAEHAGWALPGALVNAAQSARYREQARQRLAEDQLRALGVVVQRSAVPLVLVKGACVAQAYPGAWLRPYTDIDLLIAEKHLAGFLSAVLEMGYTWVEAVTGQRTWHLPPLTPQTAGLNLEVHTALARERGHGLFTMASWAGRLRPLTSFPGLWEPNPVDHALYLIHHVVVHHELTLGLLPFADLKFWTQRWGEAEWEALTNQAHTLNLQRAAGLALALTAWVWDTPWPIEIQRFFPFPPDDILAVAQRVVMGEGMQKLPHVQRDMPERNLGGLLRYLNLILLGDPATRQALPRQEKIRFYVRRPFQLLSNHGLTLWRLARGERRTRDAWRAQQNLHAWLVDEHS